MSDVEQNNDPLERFFKNSVGDYDIEYNEQDWQELEKQLDLAEAQHSAQQYRRWIAVAAVVLFALLGYFTYQNYAGINQISSRLDEGIVGESGQPEAGRNITGNAERLQNTSEEIGEENIGGDAESSLQDNDPAAITSRLSESPEITASGGLTGRNKSVGNEREIALAKANQWHIAEVSCPECTIASGQVYVKPRTLVRVKTPASGIDENYSGKSAPPSIPVHRGNKMGEETARGMRLGFVIGPDLSTAGSFSHFDGPGYKIGVTAQLNLNSRFAVSTGVVHSNIRYTAYGREYDPPNGYWPAGISAQRTRAECTLIDIPLMLKYDFLQLDRSRLFASAGFSSYIMLSEDYRFRYATDYPDLAQKWSGNTGTAHWFSNASFSVGYEWELQPGWGLQIEPFIKLPVKDVGRGNVKLYSAGTLVSLNYKL